MKLQSDCRITGRWRIYDRYRFRDYCFVLLAVAIGVYVCVSSSIKRKKAAENAIKKAWGKRVVYKGTDESFEYISHYAKGNPSESMIDDITWNDLGMDEVFKCINNTNSSVGQEYLYKMLREPVADAESFTNWTGLQMNSQLMKKKESQFRRYL